MMPTPKGVCVGVALVLSLALPPPALALRPLNAGMEESRGPRALAAALGHPSRRRSLNTALGVGAAILGVGVSFWGGRLGAVKAVAPAPDASRPAASVVSRDAQPLTSLTRLSAAAGNSDAVDRLGRLLLGPAHGDRWQALGREPDPARRQAGRQAVAQRMAARPLTPEQAWRLVAEAMAANPKNAGTAPFDAEAVQALLATINRWPYDGLYPVHHGRPVTVPWELVVGILLKETEDFQVRAMSASTDGRGLMQVNRATLREPGFWRMLRDEFGLVEGAPPVTEEDPRLAETLFDPTTNVQIGILYLRELLARLHERVPDPDDRLAFALMAYNRGPVWTFGVNDPRRHDALVGGVLKAAQQAGRPPVFEEVADLYQAPITYTTTHGTPVTLQMTGEDWAVGLDYVRTIQATRRALEALRGVEAAGLEEPAAWPTTRDLEWTARRARTAGGLDRSA